MMSKDLPVRAQRANYVTSTVPRIYQYSNWTVGSGGASKLSPQLNTLFGHEAFLLPKEEFAVMAEICWLVHRSRGWEIGGKERHRKMFEGSCIAIIAIIASLVVGNVMALLLVTGRR